MEQENNTEKKEEHTWVEFISLKKKNNYNSLKEQQIQFNSYKTDKEPLHKPNIYLLLKLSSFSCKFQLPACSSCSSHHISL